MKAAADHGWDWLTSSDAPWWAVVVAPLVAAGLTYGLTRRAARSDRREAEAAVERSAWRDRRLQVYSDYMAAILRQQGAKLHNRELDRQRANEDAGQLLQVIEMIAPPSVVERARGALDAIDATFDLVAWQAAIVALREAARADIAGPTMKAPGT